MLSQASISLRYFRPVIRRVFYVDRETSYRFSWNAASRRVEFRPVEIPPAGGQTSSGKGLSIAILGRSFYYETSRRFPITSAKDIKKAVELERGEICPFPCERLFIRSVKIAQNESAVNLWFLKDEAAKRLETLQPAFVIPETALMKPIGRKSLEATGTEGRAAPILSVKKGDGRVLFAFVNGKGICISLEEIARAPEDALERFRRMIGHEARDAEEFSLDLFGEYLGRVHEGLFELGISDVAPFLFHGPFRLPSRQKTLLTRGIGAAAAMFVLYLAGSSIVYYRTEQNLMSAYKEKKAQVSKYVDMEEKLRKQAEIYEKLVKKLQGYAPSAGLLNLLNERLPDGTVLASLRAAGSEVQIQGKTPKATRILDALNGLAEIDEPRFVTGVHKAAREDLEEFTVAFRLKAVSNK